MPQIAQGLIDFAFSPPIGVMNMHLDGNGPYTAGIHTLTSWLDGATTRSVSDTFGVVAQLNGAIPAFLGVRPGYDDGGLIVADEFQLRLLQIVVQHQTLAGPWVITQQLDLFQLPFGMRWAEALPGRVGLYVSPHIAVDLFYFLVA